MSFKKILCVLLSVITLAAPLTLTGCGEVGFNIDMDEVSSSEKDMEIAEIKLSAEVDEATDKPKTIIKLSTFDLQLPTGYVFDEIEQNDYTAYCVWAESAVTEDLYITSRDVMMYLYEGTDANSPHEELEDYEVDSSLGTYMSFFEEPLELYDLNLDCDAILTENGKSFAYSFTGSGGEPVTTTYDASCYPKSYYGIFVMDAERTGASRNWAGFVFSNDGTGEFFKKSEYLSLLSQITDAYSIENFNIEYTDDVPAELRVKSGRSYELLAGEKIYDGDYGTYYGLFYNTLLYYVVTEGRGYERTNVDEPGMTYENEFKVEEIEVEEIEDTSLEEDVEETETEEIGDE